MYLIIAEYLLMMLWFLSGVVLIWSLFVMATRFIDGQDIFEMDLDMDGFYSRLTLANPYAPEYFLEVIGTFIHNIFASMIVALAWPLTLLCILIFVPAAVLRNQRINRKTHDV